MRGSRLGVWIIGLWLVVLSAACNGDPASSSAISGGISPRPPTPPITPIVGGGSDTPAPSPTWRLFPQPPTGTHTATASPTVIEVTVEPPVVVAEVTTTAPTIDAGATTIPTPTLSAIPLWPTATVCPGSPPEWEWIQVAAPPGWNIAQLASCVLTSVEAIVQANCLPSNNPQIYAGEKLFLPSACTDTLPPPVNNPTHPDTDDPSGGSIAFFVGGEQVQSTAPGQAAEIRFSGFRANRRLTFDITIPDNEPINGELCLDNHGVGVVLFNILEQYQGKTARIDAELSNNVDCPGALGAEGEDFGMGRLTIIPFTPTPTSTMTPTPTMTPTLPETLESTPEPAARPTDTS